MLLKKEFKLSILTFLIIFFLLISWSFRTYPQKTINSYFEPHKKSSTLAVSGDLVVGGLFGDHMVLQRDLPIQIYGTAKVGQKIEISLWKGNANLAHAQTVADNQGKWRAQLPARSAGGPYSLKIIGKKTLSFIDIMVGDVWIASGQSNMAVDVIGQSPSSVVDADLSAANKFPYLRFLIVSKFPNDSPVNTIGGHWQVCNSKSVENFSALGYHFGRELNQKLNIPIGIINSSWSGSLISAWMGPSSLEELSKIENQYPSTITKVWELTLQYKNNQRWANDYEPKFINWRNKIAVPALASGDPFPEPPNPPFCKYHHYYISTLFNGMISPLIPFGIKGVIWWQGEGNSDRPNEYELAFPLLIKEWRKLWGIGDFPFLFVQVGGSNYDRAPLRQAQLKTFLSTSNTGMVVAVDIPTKDGTHAKNFQEIGRRLSLWARTKAYAETNITCSGPIYKSKQIVDNNVRLKFDCSQGGLKLKHVIPTHQGFQVAGVDGQYYDATSVKIDTSTTPNTLLVSSASVRAPQNVRYLWGGEGGNCHTSVSFYNNDDLPASPFNTDPPNTTSVEPVGPITFEP